MTETETERLIKGERQADWGTERKIDREIER
jgi:hypothetical protein